MSNSTPIYPAPATQICGRYLISWGGKEHTELSLKIRNVASGIAKRIKEITGRADVTDAP